MSVAPQSMPTSSGTIGTHLPLLRTLIAALLLTALFVSFEPFQTEFTGSAAQGNAVNQLGYSALALLAILGFATVTPGHALAALLRPVWIGMAGWLLFSTLQSPTPDAAFRAVLFTLAAMVAMAGVLCIAPDVRAFRMVLAVAALAVLGLSYFGVIAMPARAIHDASGPEAQHAGLWRGIYSHKNIAGPVMAMWFFAGLYLLRSRMMLLGGVIAVLSAVFVANTGSKTTLVLMPAVAALVIVGRLVGGRVLPVLIISAALVGMALLTLGAVLSPVLYDLLQWILPGTTFTGRLDLWRFALTLLDGRGWTGWGFESFWATPAVLHAEPSFELSWDPRGSVNAHNGYLDLAITLGWPGLALAVGALILFPLADFARVRDGSSERQRLADFFLMVLAFVLLNAFLESFFFSRANPVWMVTWMAVVGLRLLSAAPTRFAKNW